MPNILGLSAFYHNSAAALIREGKVVAAAEEERFTRKKFDSSFPVNAISEILQSQDLTPLDIDYIAYYEIPEKRFHRHLFSHSKISASSALKKYIQVQERIKDFFGSSVKIKYYPHHLSHAAFPYFLGKEQDCCALIVDAVGETTCSLEGAFIDGEFKTIHEDLYPNSLGLFYSAMTSYCGFRADSDEYKFMGLAAYGKPKYSKIIRKNLFNQSENSKKNPLVLNTEYFNFSASPQDFLFNTDKFTKLFGVPPRLPNEDVLEIHRDLAASAQLVLEEILIKKALRLREQFPYTTLVLGGGVALNCSANMKIYQSCGFKDISIPFSAGDSGSAIGAACLAYQELVKERPRIESPYLGTHDNDNLPFPSLWKSSSSNVLAKEFAKKLAENKIIALYQKKPEFGPRALGNRSILANPSYLEMKDRINAKVKNRESFRPFAPVLRKENLSKISNFSWASPYMCSTIELHKDGAQKIPAAAHQDLTARAQALPPNENEFLNELLLEFEELTGIPALLNTSFNMSDEPIVQTKLDAFFCFLRSGIDYLCIDGKYISKGDVPKAMEVIAANFYHKHATSKSKGYSF